MPSAAALIAGLKEIWKKRNVKIEEIEVKLIFRVTFAKRNNLVKDTYYWGYKTRIYMRLAKNMKMGKCMKYESRRLYEICK